MTESTQDAEKALRIRVLGSGDARQLTGVAPEVFDNAVREDLACRFLDDPRHHIAVASIGGRTVGFASAVHYLHPDKEPELWINEVGVAPPHRGRGIAKRLLAEVLALAGRLGCREAWVLTEEGNEAAVGLYESVGGVRSAPTPIMFSFPVDSQASEDR